MLTAAALAAYLVFGLRLFTPPPSAHAVPDRGGGRRHVVVFVTALQLGEVFISSTWPHRRANSIMVKHLRAAEGCSSSTTSR